MTLIRYRILSTVLVLSFLLTAMPVHALGADSAGADLHQMAEQITVGEDTHTHNLFHIPASVGTCETEGNIEYWICTDPNCGKYFLDEACTQEIPLDMLSTLSTGYVHSPIPIPAEDPTCTVDGTEGLYMCLLCEKCFMDEACTQPTTIEDRKIEKLNHPEKVKTEANAPSCISTGNKEYWYCSLCKRYYLDEACTQQVTLADTVLNYLPHTLEAHAEKKATCMTGGNIAYWYCTECKQYFSDAKGTTVISYEDTQLAPKGHTAVLVPAVTPGCTTSGLQAHYFCSACKGYFLDAECQNQVEPETLVLGPAGHHGVAQTPSRSSCTTAGNMIYYYCAGCEGAFADAGCTIPVSRKDWEIAPLNHPEEYRTHYEGEPATCLKTGIKEYWYCSLCNKYYLDADYTIETTAADLITTGTHDLTYYAAKDATCTETGNVKYWYCGTCGKYFSNKTGTKTMNAADIGIAALGHSMEYRKAHDATCTEDGNNKAYYCSRCNAYYQDADGLQPMSQGDYTISKLGHKTNTITGTAKTCTTDGLTDGVKCTRCETWIVPQQVIPHEGHKSVTVKGYAATYTSTGLTDGSKCSVCSKTLVKRKEIPMLTITAPSITALTRGAGSVTISWNKSQHADCYRILRGTGSKTENMKLLATVTETTYEDMTVKSGTKYYYRICACTTLKGEVVNLSAASGYKALVWVKAPKTVKVAPISNGLKVTFSAVTNAAEYVVQYKAGSEGWKTLDVACKASGTGSMTFSHTGLKTGTSYRYRIKALIMVDDCRHYSTYLTSAATTMVLAVSSLKSEIAITGLKLTWEKVSGATGYLLQQKTGEGSWKTIKTFDDGEKESYTCTGLVSGERYSYRIYAYKDDTAVKSAESSVVSRFFMRRPTLSSIESTAKGKLKLKWTRDAASTGYQIRYSTSITFASGTKTTTYTGSDATIIKTLSSLTSKKNYYVQIRSWKTVEGKKYYSAWSKTQQAVVK